MKKILIAFCLFFILSVCLIGQPYNVVWTDLVGTAVNGAILEKTVPSGWSNGGAASTNVLAIGIDGYVEFTAVQTNSERIFGLSEVNTNENYTTIDYAMYVRNNTTLHVYESGVYKGQHSTYIAGDLLRVERIGTTVYYKKNGVTFYTSTTTSTTSLIVDATLNESIAILTDVKASFDVPGGGGGGSNSSVWSLKDDNAYYVDGNVIVGDSIPTGKLHIKTDSAAWDGIVINHDMTSDTTYGLRINVPAASDKAFAISQGGNAQFQINGDGKAYAREVEVTLNPFPDYVFEKDYPLMPLQQLKVFIDKNKHLPNIPSAKVVDNEGIGLGDLSHKQMEKIEELTLYLLQINDRLEKLESENEALKNELNQLKQGKKN